MHSVSLRPRRQSSFHAGFIPCRSERGIPYECGLARFRETSRGHIMGLNAGMMKMLFAIGTRRLLGVHIVGRRNGADPHRPGGAEPPGHIGLLHREYVQLPHAGGGVQDRRAGRLEPDGGVMIASARLRAVATGRACKA
jgi:pyridine nucleotide-disulfide oxidoreductase